MRAYIFGSIAGLALAALALVRPAVGQDHSPPTKNSPAGAFEQSTIEVPSQFAQDDNQRGAELVGVDYCYAETIIDPVTGEGVDLYVLCSDDLEQA